MGGGTPQNVLWRTTIQGEANWRAVQGEDESDVELQNTRPDSAAIDVEEAVSVAAYYGSVHALQGPGQTALCLPCGSIRSAAFCMGVLQGLARRSLLVSGAFSQIPHPAGCRPCRG